MTCAFRHIFGAPGEGVHAPRAFGVAAVDLGLTVLCAMLIAWGRKRRRSRWVAWLTASLFWFGVLMILAFVAHVAVGVDTTLTVRIRGGHTSPCAMPDDGQSNSAYME